RFVAVAHHQRAGLELSPVDLGDFRLGITARGGLVGGIDGVGHGGLLPLHHAPRKAGARMACPAAPAPNLRRNASPPGAAMALRLSPCRPVFNSPERSCRWEWLQPCSTVNDSMCQRSCSAVAPGTS